MSIKNKAYIVGIYEHPTRLATDKTVMMLHAESAAGALADAGLTKNDIDGYFCAAGDHAGLGQLSIALITLAGRPRAEGMATGTAPRPPANPMPESGFEFPYAPATANMYAMAAMR